MSHTTYKEYKKSKIPWIDKIPSTWNTIKAKHCFNLSGGYAFKSDDFIEEGVPLVRIGDITDGTIDFNNCKRLPTKYATIMKEFLVKPGDILIALTGATIGKIGQVPETNEKILLNQRVGKLSSDSSNYYKYILSSDLIKKQINLIADGSAQENISNEDIGNFEIFDIDKTTKKQIANYLDKKTAKIDATIAKNEELIELLEEKRVALINQVVTKGLNPDAPIKDSGVKWIGEIPEHWNISRLKFLINKNAQYGANCEPEPDETKFDYRYVRITDIDDDASLKDNIVYLCKEDAKGFVLKEGDILFARSGATVGKTYLYDSSDGDCCFAGYLIRYVPNKLLLNPKYLLYFSFSKSYTEWIKIVSTQATIQNVSADKYDNLIISLPDVNEQNKIVSFLDDKITNINKTISKIQENIILLEEYKTSLIHHIVTGKIDVRGEEI